ncbi:beta strand repeat-containing protein [Paludisphaera soli]|uniref:beta strand repeat-containing protein n=1 Tax=Paludisphaera soli TaxID=2712865 RepID=UPI0013EB8B47|nr:Ig-like domain repeat protein [Paludisphaera soli]
MPPAAVSTVTATTSDADLPLGLQYAASEALGSADPSYAPAPSGAGYVLANATNAYSAYVDAGGLRVWADGDAWSLSVAGIGYGSATRPLGAATATAAANRVEYDYGGVTQWFVNGPLGLQQGFTLAERPAGAAAGGPLTIDLDLGGSLIAAADAGGTSATLARADGSASLVYGGLIAYDATGAAFPATMTVTTADAGQTLSIRVDDAGAQYPLVVDPYVQQAKVVGSVSGSVQFFGSSVSLAASGSLAVIGARSTEVSSLSIPGSAYVFSRSGSSWTQRARLLPSDGAQGDDFGAATAIAADGGTIVVGARAAEVGGNAGRGALYVFTGSGSSWTEVQKVTAADGAAGDGLGYSTSISADGAVIASGAVGVGGNQGAVYVFGKTGSTWSQGAKLTAGDGAAGALFGFSTAISGDGTTVVVGAPGASVSGRAQQGAMYVYASGGGAKLVASDGAANDGFGTSVTTNYDGSIAIAGAPYGDVGGNADQGSAYAYFRLAAGWAQSQKLTASDGGALNGYGAAVALSADGLTAAISANFATVGANSRQGAVYMLSRTGGTFTQTAKLSASDGAANDEFGLSVALSSDGSTILAGVPNKTVSTFFFQGASYFFYQQPTLAVASSPSSRTATIGVATTFTAASTGLPGRTVQWQVSPDGVAWSNIGGATRTWYTLTPTLADSGKRYRAVFSDGTGATAVTVPATLTVAKASTSLLVTASVNPRQIGDPLTITVDASAAVPGSGTPNGGTVSLNIGPVNFSGTLVNGRAVFSNIPVLALGTYTATATYGGANDPTFGDAQATATVLVVRGTSSLTAAVPSQPSTVGQPVTLTAVLGAAGNVSNLAGGVMILDRGQPIAFPQLTVANGVASASFTTTALAAGAHFFQFVYLGNPELFAASTGVFEFQVNPAAASSTPAPTSSASTSTPPPAIASPAGPVASATPGPGLFLVNPGNKTATAGSPVTFTAAPTSASTSFAQWQVSPDGNAWTNIVGANQAWYTLIPSLADSGKRYRVVFTNLQGTSETSAPSTLTVVRASTALTVSPSVNPRRIGDPLTITVDASAAVPGSGTPNGGTVSLNIGPVNFSGTLVNGRAVFSNIPVLALGTYTATATYGGANDPTFGDAQATATVLVVRGTSSLTAAVPSQPSTVGQPVTLTAVLGAAGNVSNLAGGVMILDRGQPIAFPQLTVANGVASASFTTTALAAGAHFFQFVYLGNPELFAASTGVFEFQVNPAAASSFASTTVGVPAQSASSFAASPSTATSATFVEALETIDAFETTAASRKNGRTNGFPNASAMSFRRFAMR